MNKQIKEILTYPNWGGIILEYLHCEYEMDGKIYYRPSYGFVLKNIGVKEDEYLNKIEQTFTQIVRGMENNVNLTSIKGGGNRLTDGKYINTVAYFATVENTDLEVAKALASKQAKLLRNRFENDLKGDTENINLDDHKWLIDMINGCSESEKLLSIYRGQLGGGREYKRSKNDYFGINPKYNEDLTGNVYTSMMEKEKNYLLINTLYNRSKNIMDIFCRKTSEKTCYSQMVGIFKDEFTRDTLNNILVGSVALGKTQQFEVINYDIRETENTLDMVGCFNKVRGNDSCTLVSAEEIPFMYPPRVALIGFNPIKDVPASGYYRLQNSVPKNNFHHLGKCIDPNTLKKTDTPVDLMSPLHTGIFGTTNVGKSTLACHIMLNYLEQYKGSRVILFNNKKEDDFYNALKNVKKDHIKVKIWSLGDLSGATGSVFYNNLFFIPEGSQLQEWIDHIVGVLCKSLGQRDRTLAILTPKIKKMYNEVGIFEKTKDSFKDMLEDEEFKLKVESIKKELKGKMEETTDKKKKIRLERRCEILTNMLSKSVRPTEDKYIINRENAKYLRFEDILEKIVEEMEKTSSEGKQRVSMNTANTMQSMRDKFYNITDKGAISNIANEELEQDPFEKILQDGPDITIFNTSGMGLIEKQIIGEIMIRYMYSWIFQNKRTYNLGSQPGEKSFMLIMEEAGTYFNNAASGDSGNSVIDNEIWDNIAKEGRSSGLCYTVITQNPKDLPSFLLDQLKNIFILRLNDNENKIAALQAVGYYPEKGDMELASWLTPQPIGWVTYKCTGTNLNDSKPILIKFNEIY